ncbi:MAG TPA: right-handed parallel beta-helix repeat-containing protein [Chthoniobacterales bacterium]
MKAFDFGALVRNQWVIVCSLVGLVALCTTVVDVFTGKFGSSTVTQNQNNNQATNQASPQQQVVSKPKHGRQWVLDSTGAGDSDAKDFVQILNGLQDGDTIEVRAGSYDGPLTLAKSVVVTGDTDQKTGARASIHYSGGNGCAITGGQVTLQNFDFSETSEGGSVLISAGSQSVVQIKNCNLVSRGSHCVGALENAQLTLQDSSLRTLGKGYGCYVKGNAKATIERCTFEENLGCVQCTEAGSVVINDSKFQNNITSSKDAFLVLLSGTGSAEVNRCTFTENTTAVADAQGRMTLTNCRFEKNREGYWKYIAVADASGKLTLTGCEFVSNPRAVVASNGAQLTVDGCKFQSSGQIPQVTDARAYFANLLVMGQGSLATVTNTTFTDVQFEGVLVADQAQARLKDVTIQGGQYGINLGVTTSTLTKGGFAELENVTLSGQIGQPVRMTRASYLKMLNCHIDGDAWDSSIYVYSGSSVEMTGCDIKGGKGNGLEAIGQDSQVHAERCQFLSFQGSGVLARDQAKIVLSGCTLEQNAVGAQAGGEADGASQGGTITLENCTIRSNRTYGVSAINRGYVGLTATTFDNQPTQTFKDTSGSVQVR